MADDIKKLELRITELENQLKGMKGQGGQADIDPEDMKVYERVSKQLGAQDLQSVIRCISCVVCYRCINECICGPCNICILGGVGGTRFSALG